MSWQGEDMQRSRETRKISREGMSVPQGIWKKTSLSQTPLQFSEVSVSVPLPNVACTTFALENVLSDGLLKWMENTGGVIRQAYQERATQAATTRKVAGCQSIGYAARVWAVHEERLSVLAHVMSVERDVPSLESQASRRADKCCHTATGLMPKAKRKEKILIIPADAIGPQDW